MQGWIKLHRQFEQWEWYDDTNVKVLFLHMLIRANHKPSSYKGYTIPAGSLVTGRVSLGAKLGMSEQQIRTALKKLKSTGEITIKKTNKFSIVSISCWDDYQGDNQQITNNQPTSNQQVTTSKERKKVRREEEVSTAPIAAGDFDSFWALYPRKLEKKAARKSYQTALKTTSPEDILTGLTAYCEEIRRNGTETRFIKHCTTWLNQGCWEDDHTEIIHPGGNNQKPRGFAEIALEVGASMARGEH